MVITNASAQTVAAPPVPRDLPPEPLAGRVAGIALSMVSIVIISIILTQRSLAVKAWRQLPPVQWLVFAIYIDSFLFVFTTSVLKFGFGFASGSAFCEGAILLCLICYVSTKHIIRGGIKWRIRSKLYLFNSVGLTGLYSVIVVLNFVFRIARLDNGECVVGMQKIAMIPLIGFDTLINAYLTILFLIPICRVHHSQSFYNTPAKSQLRHMAIRSFIGALCTLASSIANLTVLMVLDGEAGWVCLMCCNTDILISALVVQWVTSKETSASTESDNTAQFSLAEGDSTHSGEPGRSASMSASLSRTVGVPLGVLWHCIHSSRV
ncbi:hypothetical protein F4801DRAFT_581336 [Xylaria longipes]|nr:hypothetical protein F4801DRAFT_581336 [Xylaria longipes]